jgi:hypothetical protein
LLHEPPLASAQRVRKWPLPQVAQPLHELWPFASWKRPLAQFEQAVSQFAEADLNFPAPHWLHVPAAELPQLDRVLPALQGVQSLHDLLPSPFWYSPVGHCVHCVSPVSDWYLPAVHGAQSVCPVASRTCPAGQLRQWCSLVRLWSPLPYFPTSHSTQPSRAGALWYWPDWHALQAWASVWEAVVAVRNLPATHLMHPSCATPLWYVPDAHTTHAFHSSLAADTLARRNLPAPQLLQSDCTCAGWNWPLGHAAHVDCLAVANVPAAHGTIAPFRHLWPSEQSEHVLLPSADHVVGSHADCWPPTHFWPAGHVWHVRSLDAVGAFVSYSPAAHGTRTSRHSLPSSMGENVAVPSHSPHTRFSFLVPAFVWPAPAGQVRHAAHA